MTRRLVDVRISREQVGYWAVSLGLLVTVAYVAWRFVGTFVLGLFLYYVTRPVHREIHARLRGRIRSRTVSVTVALLSVTLPVVLLVFWTLSVAIDAFQTVFGTGAPVAEVPGVETAPTIQQLVELAQTNVDAFLSDPGGWLQTGIVQSLIAFFDAVSGSIAVVVNGGLHFFIALILLFFFLRDDYRIEAWARSVFLAEGGVIESYLSAVDRDLHQVYFGNILNAVLTAALGALSFSVLNLVAPETVRIPEPTLFGLLAGVASLVPVIGIKLVWVPLAAILLVDAWFTDPTALWFVAVFVVVSVVVVDTVPDQLLRPYVSGRSLHVGAVMIAYTVGPLLFGWYGIFLGPLLLVVVIEGARYVLPAALNPDAVPAGSTDGDVSGPEAALSESMPTADADETPAEAGDEDSDSSVPTS